VADASNFTIRGILPAGTNWVVSTLAGTALIYGFADGVNDAAQFDYPYNIALTGAGVLYVTDFGNYAIRQITPVGPDWVTRTIAGFSGVIGTNDGAGGIASFNNPNGIAVDGATNLYVTDQFNHTIRKVAPSGSGWMVSTLAGAAGQRGTNDGIGDKARFNKPWGIAVDGMGNLFVVDYLNQTIRKGVPPPIPTLEIFRSANQVVLAWPAAATNYVLESTGNLQPGAIWAPVTNAIVTSGDNRFRTNQPEAAAAFFRLYKQ